MREHTQTGDFDLTHLTFFTKVQVWGRMVRASLQVPSISKAIQKIDVALSCLRKEREKAEKRERNDIYRKKEKGEEDKREEHSPLLDLCYH